MSLAEVAETEAAQAVLLEAVLLEALVARPLWGEAARVSSLPPLRRKQTARVQK